MSAREHIHLIGIGGTGMSALAGLLHDSGCRVTGSDRKLYPPTSTLLAGMGLKVYEEFDPVHLDPAPDLVVIGNAVRRGNPEGEEVLDRDLEYRSMPQVLSERFLRHRHAIVVAGTHGKTTTASMLAWVLQRAGRDPGFLIGGLPVDLERPYRIGTGPAFVVEGDEYDTAFFDKGPKFMHYRPDTALLGTVEFDHADIFRDFEEVRRAFRWFVNLVPRRGLLVRHEDCTATREVSAASPSRVAGYGLEAGEWRAQELLETDAGTSYRLVREGVDLGVVRLAVSGEHNVRNSLAVAAAAHEQGLSIEEIGAGLASFRGVRRRLEVRGEVRGVTVLDDFAHHPTAIGETLRAVRRRFRDRRVWAVFEPRSGSMRRNVFQESLPEAFSHADEVVLARVFGAEEIAEERRLDPERLVRDLERRGTPARFLEDVATIVEWLSERVRAGDVVVVMSNGGFDGLHGKLLDALSERRP